MSRFYRTGAILDFVRDETAGVPLEYALVVVSMLLFVAPSISYYSGGVRKLLAFVGLLHLHQF